MSTDEKLAAILAAVQTDPGNRGLARDPRDNLFTACPGDFAAVCRGIAGHPAAAVEVVTGFFIPGGEPPAFETDGPLGAFFLQRSLAALGIGCTISAEPPVLASLRAASAEARFTPAPRWAGPVTHTVWVERAGPAADGRHYTMRGRDITPHLDVRLGRPEAVGAGGVTIGIGDGGNEVGMGKVAHETVVRNIPNGDLVHCRVATGHLIVAGVSNWGAYALAAGLSALRGAKPPADLFDPDREREILGVMVREGPLVDGVTGKPTATVDGLSWEEYVRPLVRICEILEG